MALSIPTSLTANGDATDATSYTTGVVSPAGGSMLFLFVSNGTGTAGNNDIPTLTGTLGLTWAQILTDESTAKNIRGTWFQASVPATPPSGTIVMNFATLQSNCQWHLTQLASAASNRTVQSKTQQMGTALDPSMPLASLPLADSVVLGAIFRNSNIACTALGGFTILSSVPGSTVPACGSDVAYDINSAAQSVSFGSGSGAVKTILGVEIAFSAQHVALENANKVLLENGTTLLMS